MVDVPRTHGNFWFATEIATAFVGFEVGADVWLRHTDNPLQLLHVMRYQADLGPLADVLTPSGTLVSL
jgi:hypothetical protein